MPVRPHSKENMDDDNINRWNMRVLAKALKSRRAVVISGARQCVKSTLIEMFFDGGVVLYTSKETL